MEWFKKNKKIVIGVLVVVVLACISVGAYLVSGNAEPKKANKEIAEKTVEKQEDSEEVQDEEQVTENVDTDTVLDESTQTETDEVVEEEVKNETTVTQSTQSSNSGNSNKGNSGNKNTTTNKNTNSDSTTNNSGNNTTNSGNSGSTANSGSTNGTGNKTQSTSGKQLSPAQIAAVNAGYYKVVTSSEGYSVMVHDGEYEKGMKILEDYLATLGYERIGGSGSWIDNSCDQYGVYVDYNEIRKIPTEDDIVWG